MSLASGKRFMRAALMITILLALACGMAAVYYRDTFSGRVQKAGDGQPVPGPDREFALKHQELVAHAGGAIYGYRFTNSLEALNSSYSKGFRFLELDFDWSRDGYPVLIHDWDAMFRRLFMAEPMVYTLNQFKNAAVFQNLTVMDLEDLNIWLSNHADAYVVSDVKTDNIKMLTYIKNKYPNMVNRILPQIYSFDEFDAVSRLGYENIILTLYRMEAIDDNILKFAGTHRIYAVTMNEEQGMSGLPSKLREMGLNVYAYPVDDLSVAERLKANGVFGFYTDYFEPGRWVTW